MVKINRKWAVVTCLNGALDLGNSLVPGSGSGSLSLTVMELSAVSCTAWDFHMNG